MTKTVNHKTFIVTISEMGLDLEHKNHVMTIQLHKKHKKDLQDILLGWFEKDYEKVNYIVGNKVKHCPDCGVGWVFKHNFCRATIKEKND